MGQDPSLFAQAKEVNPMPEHFPRNTVSAAFYCSKCQRQTQHRIDDRRKGPCLECIAKLEREHQAQPIELTTGTDCDPLPAVRIGNVSDLQQVETKTVVLLQWCFCKGCYFALKTSQPSFAAGLWKEAFDSTHEFFENYARAKAWLQTTGLQRNRNEQGGLFA